MKAKRCACCGKTFQPRPQVPHQSYCSSPACQSERRRRWQYNKLKSDPDYRENQKRAQRAWLDRNPEYWRQYRQRQPDYVRRNRNPQGFSSSTPGEITLAKMDASNLPPWLPAGVYWIKPAVVPSFAKSDVWMVEIRPVRGFGGISWTLAKR